ncbi:MAG: N-acetyl-gamma-glutamyl-phosphate reductase [Pelagibacteraceae bacterium]
MSLKNLNIAVLGATGYVGLDLVYLLSKHPNVKIKYLCAQKSLGKNINNFDKRIKKKLPKISNIKKVNWSTLDLVFLSLPNGQAHKIVNKLYSFENLKFIDLSADFRLTNSKEYKKWYFMNHGAKNKIKDSIYSIAEFVKKDIKNYKIIANPGCYPTSIQLPLIPLIKKNCIQTNNIIIDSKSGYSGAGKNFTKKFKYKNIYKSIYPYGLVRHRHMAEIDQQLKKIKSKIYYSFNPYIIPTFRGILSSIYVDLKKGNNIKKVKKILSKYYLNNTFIKIEKINKSIGTGDVLGTNYCKISVCETRNKNKIVIFSAIDNLIKGASGQAIQNMNLIYNFKEKAGLS